MTSFENKLVPHDVQVSEAFLRYLLKDSGALVHFDTIMALMAEDASATAFAGLSAALDQRNLSMGDFLKGMVCGVALACGSTQTGDTTIQGFLADLKNKPQNITDIRSAMARKAGRS